MKQVYKACIMELMLDSDHRYSVESIHTNLKLPLSYLPYKSKEPLERLIDQAHTER